MPSYKPIRSGLTITEVVVSSLIVGIVIVGSLNALNGSIRTQAKATALMVGPMLADQLLAEIIGHPYEDPETGNDTHGLEAGESNSSRLDWDDVDDYNTLAQNPPRMRDGTQLTEYSDWTRRVDVWWAERLSGNLWFFETGLKGITVRAIYHEGQPDQLTITRVAFRCEEGVQEKPPNTDKTVVTHVAAEIDLGTGSIRQTTNLLNHVGSPNE